MGDCVGDLVELEVRYSCDACGDEFTITYEDLSEVESQVDHDDCPERTEGV